MPNDYDEIDIDDELEDVGIDEEEIEKQVEEKPKPQPTNLKIAGAEPSPEPIAQKKVETRGRPSKAEIEKRNQLLKEQGKMETAEASKNKEDKTDEKPSQQIDILAILQNHEARIRDLEATLFRLKSI